MSGFVLPPGGPLGNNGNTRVVALHVMNGTLPTRAQLTEAEQVFNDHMATAGLSLAGFSVEEQRLADGSILRIVSNSGLHTLQLWPAAEDDTPQATTDLFWGVPVNAANPSGALPPIWLSAQAKIKRNATNLPETIQPIFQLGNHPGHITWSSDEFKGDGERVVVGIRGPRDRYTAPKTTISGSGAYDQAGTTIGDTIFRDDSAVWLNAIAKNNVWPRIVAACLHRPDPAKPGEIVLRVYTNNLSGNNATFARGVVDLVPTGATKGVSLGEIYTATSFVSIGSYAAPAGYSPQTRPYFDSKGERIVAVCSKSMVTTTKGATRTGRVILVHDPKTWAELQQVDAPSSYSESITASVGTTGASYTSYPNTATIGVDYAMARAYRNFIAADFMGDDVVWVALDHTRTETASIDSQHGRTGTFDYTASETRTGARETLNRIVHSHHGVLYEDEWTYAESADYNASETISTGSATGTVSGGQWRNSVYVFIGDLSQDVFAIGTQHGVDRIESQEVSGPPFFTQNGQVSSGYAHIPLAIFCNATAPLTTPLPKWDVWAGGIKRAAQTTGGFANSAPIVTSTTLAMNFTLNVAVDYRANGTTPVNFNDADSWNGGPIAGTRSVPIGGTGIELDAPPQANVHRHIAVTARGDMAYIGASYTQFGLELVADRGDSGAWTMANPPNYAGGTRPSISAPVFAGFLTR
jgi:hypothetical protein